MIDKSKWGEGQWTNENDREEWRHAGFPCLAVRHPSLGHWCGYVGVPPGHACHGKGYSDIDVEAHGGLTYANACEGDVCHVAKPGEPEEVWWFGFDCAHSGDVSTVMSAEYRYSRVEFESYRDINYVRNWTNKIAEQLSGEVKESSHEY